MKTCVRAILGLALSASCALASSAAFASVHDRQTNLELEAMALIHLSEMQAEAQAENLRLGGIGDVVTNIGDLLKQIEDIKDQLVEQFDENKNGRIDPGPELDNFKETMQSVILLLADSNSNGRIDLQDIKVLTETLLDQAKEKTLEVACPTVIREAEKAGWWLRFRPVLKHFYEICTFAV